MSFKKNNEYNFNKLYEKFLNKIDPLSQTIIRGYDMSFNNFKDKLKSQGIELTELGCFGQDVLIKRNISGFYLVNKTKKGLSLINKYENDFRLIHFYLLDKERIIRGDYTCKKRNEKVLENIIKQLAYGEIRDKILREKWVCFVLKRWKNGNFGQKKCLF